MEQTPSLEPTPRSLNVNEEGPPVAKVVKRLKFKREDPQRRESSKSESNRIPAVPRRRCYFRCENLSPATRHWTNVLLPNSVANIVFVRAFISNENCSANSVSERR